MRDPLQEARDRLDRLEGRYEPRVLEPSPPAVNREPWFADDPVARGEIDDGRRVVSPVTTGDVLWDDLARDDPALAEWCAPRWLGAYRRLEPPPPGLESTRTSLHRVAERAMTPARRRANGKIALRYVAGGFGTPFFGEDTQVRVDGTDLVVDSPGGERRTPLTTLSAAADAVGVPLEGEEAHLDVDQDASRFLGDWYGFAASVLEQLRAEATPELEPSRVQLWTEHFDLAFEQGSQDTGARAGYGGSPGDELHPEPYLYVVPWEPSRAEGDGWNAEAFAGAELGLADLLASPDQRGSALDFFRDRLRALTA